MIPKISPISQKFASSHVFQNLNFNSFNPYTYGDAFEENILFEYELQKKKIYRVKEESNAATIYVSEEIKKYKYIEENMHFKYSYRICIILRIFFRK